MTDPEPQPQPDPQLPPSPPGGGSYDPFVAADVLDPEDRHPFWGWWDLAIFAGLAVATFVVVMFAGGLVIAIVFGTAEVAKMGAVPVLVVQFAFYGAFFLLLALFFRFRYDRPLFRSLSWGSPGPWILLRSGMWGVFTAVGAALLAALLRTPRIETPLEMMLRDPLSLALVAAFAVTLGPLCEELIFRGLIFPVVARTFGVAAAVTLTALPFALMHGSQYAWTWQHLLMVFIAGCGFGITRHVTNSTAAATVMHVGYNATFVAGLIAQRAGWLKG